MQQRWIPVLALVLALQIGGAAALVLRGTGRMPVLPQSPLIADKLDGVDQLVLDGPVSPEHKDAKVPKVTLARQDGRWVLPDYFGAPADQTKVKDLLARLGKLQRGLPVATSVSALDRFRVDAGNHERRLRAVEDGREVTTLYLGSSPGLRQSDARTASDRAVYAVDLATYELPTKPADWFDQRLLQRPAEDLTALGLQAPGRPALSLSHASPTAADAPANAVASVAGDKAAAQPATPPTPAADASVPAAKTSAAPAWFAQGLAPGQGVDANGVEALLKTIAHIKVDEILGTQARPEWHQDQPELVLALTDKAGKARTWTFSKPSTGDYRVLKVSDRPWYFRLGAWNAQPLIDAAAPGRLVLASAPGPADNAASAPAAATAPAPQATKKP